MEELEIFLETENNQEQEISLFSENISYAGGTSNYLDLENKPTINGVELNGNKTTEDLGIEAGKEVYIGIDEPTGKEVIWIDPNGETDIIPTKTSQLENDSKFVDENYVDKKIGEIEFNGGDVDLSEYAKKTDIPTKISQLENDVSFATITHVNNSNALTKAYVDGKIGNVETLLGGI